MSRVESTKWWAGWMESCVSLRMKLAWTLGSGLQSCRPMGSAISVLKTAYSDRPVSFDTGDEEMLVLPLSGSCTVTCGSEVFELAGRPSVFAGPSDFVYLPISTQVSIAGRLMLAIRSPPVAFNDERFVL